VLERHHPDYCIGEVKATQSFLPRSMTPADIADVIQEVLPRTGRRFSDEASVTIRWREPHTACAGHSV
jgi:hypothetical protein